MAEGVLVFLSGCLGRAVDYDGVDGPTCVDLVNTYLQDCLGRSPVHGDAIDIAHQKLEGFVWVDNAPVNFPDPGDIVVWHPSISLGIPAAGHCGVVLTADPHVLITADQNWPAGARVSIILHGYQAVAGWQSQN